MKLLSCDWWPHIGEVAMPWFSSLPMVLGRPFSFLFRPLYLISVHSAIRIQYPQLCLLHLSPPPPQKMLLRFEVPGMGRTAPVDIYHLKTPTLKGKHKITQHWAFMSFFSFSFVSLTSCYHILGHCCMSISIVSKWNKCKLLFFFFSKVIVGIWCRKWVTKPCRKHHFV